MIPSPPLFFTRSFDLSAVGECARLAERQRTVGLSPLAATAAKRNAPAPTRTCRLKLEAVLSLVPDDYD
ncbi:MAG: hypothetical protein DME45_05945 [Verrucomicrobia bacterium]|nr:MAG: hypothetical protein DME45_05945 [Verrucomicrobiota bacterium]